MDKEQLIALLKEKHSDVIVAIVDVNLKKLVIKLNLHSTLNLVSKDIEKSIQSSDYSNPLLVSIMNGFNEFSFSCNGGIYEFTHDNQKYLVEYDLKSYVLTFDGETISIPGAEFEHSKHYQKILVLINEIISYREKYLAY